MITWIGSPNFTQSRSGKKIDRLVLHWIVGKLNVADKVFQDTVRNTSAHYGIGNEIVHQYVNESDTAYHAGSWEVNLRSIGIEHEGGPNLPISDATYNTSAKLVADICKRYNIPLDRQHILKHQEIVPTQCPGTLDIDRIIAEAISINNAIIAQPILQQFTNQTIIPKELLGTDENKEIQQIRGLLTDLKTCQAQLSEATKPSSGPKTADDATTLPPDQIIKFPPVITKFFTWLLKIFK